MEVYIPTEQKLKELIEETVLSVFEDKLPQVLRQAKKKPWMNTKEAMEFLGVNRRQLQYLKDKKKIPFSQSGRKIFYPTQGLENWLKDNMPERWAGMIGSGNDDIAV